MYVDVRGEVGEGWGGGVEGLDCYFVLTGGGGFGGGGDFNGG